MSNHNALHSQDLQDIVPRLGQDARIASKALIQASEEQINSTLHSIAKNLRLETEEILEANKKDIKNGEEKNLSKALIDRLLLTQERVENIASACEAIAQYPDPIGKTLWETIRPNGLIIERVSVPIGVLGMIYESRPNVTIDAACLCLKSRNSVILRGGSESLHSSLFLHSIIAKSLEENELPSGAVSIIPIADRSIVGEMLSSPQYIDVMIPRGGAGLTSRVMAEAKMPVFSHLDGICHIYIHPSVKPEIARQVTLNAKMRRTGICGALETLILDSRVDDTLAKRILDDLIDDGCEIVGDKLTQALHEKVGPASTQDWHTEYLDKKLSCCVVSSVEEAVEHINSYGSHHTDSILAEDKNAVAYFLQNVDSGIVMHNTSTQFADGGEFGMGAEIGIATGKMHARGPVGIEQLCTYKYLVKGSGQTRP